MQEELELRLRLRGLRRRGYGRRMRSAGVAHVVLRRRRLREDLLLLLLWLLLEVGGRRLLAVGGGAGTGT